MNRVATADLADAQLDLEVDLNPGPPKKSQKGSRKHVTRAEGEAAVTDLFDSAFRLKGKPYLKGLLKFVTKTRQYSIFNQSLIFHQRPGVTAVGTPSYWARHNRSIKDDALPLVILQPKGPVCFVYELADTEGWSNLFGRDDLDPFSVQGEVTDEDWYQFLADVARDKFFLIKERRNGWSQAGSIGLVRASPNSMVYSAESRFRILIAARLSCSAKAATLAHELAHAFCGHIGQLPKCWWPARTGLTKDVKEFEAEVVSWIVSRRAGLETRSAEYLLDHTKPYVLAEISIDAIVRAANRIESLGFPKSRR